MYRTLSLSKIENTDNHFTSSSWACLRCSKYLAFRFPLVTRIISLVASTSNCIGKCTAKCKAFSAAVFQVRRDEFAGFSDYAGNFISLMSWSPIATLMVDMNHVRMWCNVNHYRVRLKGGSQVAWMLQAKASPIRQTPCRHTDIQVCQIRRLIWHTQQTVCQIRWVTNPISRCWKHAPTHMMVQNGRLLIALLGTVDFLKRYLVAL